jgi:NADH-quinone oxidoreductase subunit H
VAFAFGVSTMAAVAILAAGWGGNNKYSLLGGARAVAQLISYEIPVVLSVLSMALVTGTLSMTEMVNGQESAWNIVRHAPIAVPALLMFLIGTLAELNRTPFDLPEAESELVSGFHTEYSGMRFALFYLAEFANNFFSAGFAVVMFFGGWRGPVLPEPVWFTIKTVLVITLLMWIRWTMPRLRVDQMMGFCWKLLVPAGLVLLCGASMWALWQR